MDYKSMTQQWWRDDCGETRPNQSCATYFGSDRDSEIDAGVVGVGSGLMTATFKSAGIAALRAVSTTLAS
ncbi:MAG: hypothetical protein K9L65_03680, partial [Chromatiaceae bacterium]|nr:hypothetical protein [Chromatiaceae bacterium]